jgi:anti-sigma regulatory factor (Ser/Thr protein kinase)
VAGTAPLCHGGGDDLAPRTPAARRTSGCDQEGTEDEPPRPPGAPDDGSTQCGDDVLAQVLTPHERPSAPGRVLRPVFGRTAGGETPQSHLPTRWGASRPCPALDADLGAPRIARHAVREGCAAAGLSAALERTAVLLASEVVTNAVRHASGRPRLSVDACGEGITVEVGDDDVTYPVLRAVGLEAQGGRGIGLLDRLADAWGVRAPSGGGVGKVVWFELRAV